MLTKKPFQKRSEQGRKARRGKTIKLNSPTQFIAESGRVITIPPGKYHVQGDLTRIR